MTKLCSILCAKTVVSVLTEQAVWGGATVPYEQWVCAAACSLLRLRSQASEMLGALLPLASISAAFAERAFVYAAVQLRMYVCFVSVSVYMYLTPIYVE